MAMAENKECTFNITCLHHETVGNIYIGQVAAIFPFFLVVDIIMAMAEN
jgi:hypothetical protein